MVVRKVGKYEIGRTIGEGTFAKVKFAQNTETGESVAMKVLDRSAILKHKMVEQIKREISIMKLVRHPHVVRLHEVIASRTKIYIILEYITGGELFDKIVHNGRLSEVEARKYFQQLIDGVECCHNKGVYHRDLKPENLLLDSQGNLKISDFGLSAQPPEIENADFSFPSWFSTGAKSLIQRMLDPNPETRIRIEEIKDDEWFQRGYTPVRLIEYEDVNLDDIYAVFDATEEQEDSQHGNNDLGPLVLNAFDLIILSQGLNLETLFDKSKDLVTHQTRFISQKPAKVVLSSMEVVAQSMGFKTHIRNFKMRIEGLSADKTGQVHVILEVFEVAPTFFMVDIQRIAGDQNEYFNFYKQFCENLDDIIWKPLNESGISRVTKSKTRKRP
ncbi:hypothetical protein KSS87_005541 [Heliosperma pusillum]|nr:hypothetical protein KSS87_005541 [Heliosperma pusillum]